MPIRSALTSSGRPWTGCRPFLAAPSSPPSYKDLKPTTTPKSPSRFTLDYEKCTEAELKRFIQSRGLVVPRKGKVKAYKQSLATRLDNADSKATFRFLGLPPELRNNIYRELLLFDSDKGRSPCWPAILATSKDVNREGTGIFLRDNTFTATLSCNNNYKFSARFDGHVMDTVNASIGLYSSLKWPSRLLNSTKCKITLDLCEADRIRGTEIEVWVNHILYNLYSCMLESNNLQRLEVEAKMNNALNGKIRGSS